MHASQYSSIFKGFSIAVCCLLLSLTPGFSQEDPGRIKVGVEAGGFISTGKTLPFWMRTNQYGEVPLESGVATIRAEIKKDYQRQQGRTNRFSYGFGVRGVANAGTVNEVLLPEAYAKVRFGAIELYGGRRKEMMGLADSTLSGGSFIWSGNALPIPKIQISIPNYTPILGNGLVSVKGNFAHGWFGSTDITNNYMLHQKSFYLRLGKPEWRFRIHGGLNHQAQWGGSPVVPFVDNLTGRQVTKFGSSMKAFYGVVTGMALNTDDDPDIYGEGSFNEAGNRVGNHLGTVDVALEFNSPANNVLIYRQSFYEDGSLYFLNNIKDGLNGISLTRKGVTNGLKKIVIEYLHTFNQGGIWGSSHDAVGIPELRGRDNYFFNTIYKDGWTYKSQVIGTPFIMSRKMVTSIPANYSDENRSSHSSIVNNRVKALMLAMENQFSGVNLITRVAFSRNFGTYAAPFSKVQTSIQQSIDFPVKSFRVSTMIAYDHGDLLEKSLGLNLFVRRNF